MLISTKRNFVFVANLKTGSTSIEKRLAPHAEIAVTETRIGKHAPLTKIAKRFSWLFKAYPLGEQFVFGVIRDPVGYMLSLYNSHHVEPRGPARPSVIGQDFDDFARSWVDGSWQAQPQRRMFVLDGRVAVSALIDFADIDSQFGIIARHLGLDLTLDVLNKSPEVLTRADIAPETLAFIRERFTDDYNFHQRFAGKTRWGREDGSWVAISEESLPPTVPAPAGGLLDRLPIPGRGQR